MGGEPIIARYARKETDNEIKVGKMDKTMDIKEINHLEYIIKTAQEQLEKSEEKSKNKQAEILEAKREQRENTASQMGNLYSSDGFEQLVELSQYAEEVSRQVEDYEMEEQKIKRLHKVIKTPYFARIDFTFQGDAAAEQIYIGRFTLTGDRGYDIKVYDWRSPIASVFYRYGMGNAEYNAPSGTIHGEVSLKRQYEIKDSELKYYFDSEMEIMDEFLKRLLAQNASKSMHAIVETIQKDQDIVIRDITNDLMMVQGVAGSGKTSVALHRAAFLMYQGIAGKLLANNILIISPNSLFEQYISRVLPELGEENVVSYIFEDIIDNCIHPKNLQSYREFLELAAESKYKDGIMAKSFEYKTSPTFIKYMKQFVARNKDAKNGRELYLRLLEKKQTDDEIFEYSLENMNTRILRYEDALCISFLQLLKRGAPDECRAIRQVIIDEVQDYTPLHFEILKIMYPQASYTTLGDINQSVSRKVTIDFYDQISQILDRPKSLLVNMNKSFRCSRQILEFSASFLDDSVAVESFCRDGDEPQTHNAQTEEERNDFILQEVRTCLERGFESVALICENQKAANELQRSLSKQLKKQSKKSAQPIEISVVADNNESPLSNVFTIPLYMAKGLEFDGVLVIDITNRQHMYIASTRALHRLTVFKSCF